MRPIVEDCNRNSDNTLQHADDTGRSTGRSESRSGGKSLTALADAELAAVVAAWPHLLGPICSAIRALISAAADE